MTSVRVSRPSRSNGRGAGDLSVPSPAVADLLAGRGWGIVEQDERPRPDGAGVRRWVVVDEAGRYLDVGLLPVPAEPAARARLVEQLDALRSLDHEHLAVVEEIVEAGEGYLALVSRRPPGGGLELLLSCRGPLAAGEAVTLLVPLAQALAVLHGSGLSYGGVDLSDVLVDADGRPVLRSPLDLCALPATEDVRTLAELAVGVLPGPDTAAAAGDVGAGEPDPGLAALHVELAAARRSDARVRPEIGTFAALCYEAAPPAPITMPDPARLAAAAIAARQGAARGVRRSPREDPAGSGAVPGVRTRRGPGGRNRTGPWSGPLVRHTRGARRRSAGPGADRHPGLVAGLVLLACAVLVAGGLLLRPHLGDQQAAQHASTGPEALADPPAGPAGDPTLRGDDPTLRGDDPAGAAVALTERRVELLAGDGAPSEVLVAGSPAAAADATLLDRIATSGVVIDGARAAVDEARVVGPGADARPADERPSGPSAGSSPDLGDQTQVEVTYSVSEHTQSAADGTRTTVPASAASTAVLTLRWTDLGWRVSEVG